MMHRLPQAATASVRGLNRTAVGLRSTQTLTDVDASSSARPADWDAALPYSAVPGPKPLPVVGSIGHFLPGGQFYKIPTVKLLKAFMSYGKVAKMAGVMGKPDMVVITCPEEIAKIYRNEGTWPIRQGADCLSYYFTHLRPGYRVSLVSSQGKDWQEFRSAVNQVMMQPRNVKQYVGPIDEVSKEFIDRMRAIRTDKMEMPPSFTEELAKWALESITFVALDARLGLLVKNLPPDSDGSKMVQSVHVVADSIYSLDMMPSPWKYVSTPAWRKFTRAMDQMTEVSSKYVSLAMERLKSKPATNAGNRMNHSVLESLLIKNEDPSKAVAMAIDMMLAGIETTSTVVSTVLYQLTINPDKQRKLQEELDRVIPDPHQPLTAPQLEEMSYLRACVKETMRVMPILLGNTRTTVKDLVIGGYQFPQGTMITTFNSGLSENEKYFPRAKEFLPERWLPGHDDIRCKDPFAFLPFGFGPRMCVGRRFANMEIETLSAKIFRNFTLEWNKPPVQTSFKASLNFVDPLALTTKDRI